jgi:hypothetical protein
MAQPKPTAAQALYSHLPSAAREPVKQAEPRLADALFPSLSRAAKQRDAEQERWDAWRKRERDSLLRHLREANAKAARGRG